jgi:hypothetical protein
MQLIEVPTRKRNRYLARRPRAGFFWCGKCDQNKVAEGAKCSVCGALNGRRRKHRNEIAIK